MYHVTCVQEAAASGDVDVRSAASTVQQRGKQTLLEK